MFQKVVQRKPNVIATWFWLQKSYVCCNFCAILCALFFYLNAKHHEWVRNILKLINNSSIYKPVRIRQFGHMCVFRNPDETLDRGFSTIL